MLQYRLTDFVSKLKENNEKVYIVHENKSQLYQNNTSSTILSSASLIYVSDDGRPIGQFGMEDYISGDEKRYKLYMVNDVNKIYVVFRDSMINKILYFSHDFIYICPPNNDISLNNFYGVYKLRFNIDSADNYLNIINGWNKYLSHSKPIQDTTGNRKTIYISKNSIIHNVSEQFKSLSRSSKVYYVLSHNIYEIDENFMDGIIINNRKKYSRDSINKDKLATINANVALRPEDSIENFLIKNRSTNKSEKVTVSGMNIRFYTSMSLSKHETDSFDIRMLGCMTTYYNIINYENPLIIVAKKDKTDQLNYIRDKKESASFIKIDEYIGNKSYTGKYSNKSYNYAYMNYTELMKKSNYEYLDFIDKFFDKQSEYANLRFDYPIYKYDEILFYDIVLGHYVAIINGEIYFFTVDFVGIMFKDKKIAGGPYNNCCVYYFSEIVNMILL